MKIKVMFPIAVMLFAAACGRDSVGARSGQKDYEVVQEGSANGVTSTIQGPGETLPPMTGTNADTTTAFGIDPNAVASTPVTGTIAGTYPAPYTPPTPRTEPAAPAPRPESQTPQRPVSPPSPAPEPRVEPPTMTDTATVPEPAPAPEQEPEDEGQSEENPPPTTTDTRGQ